MTANKKKINVCDPKPETDQNVETMMPLRSNLRSANPRKRSATVALLTDPEEVVEHYKFLRSATFPQCP